ncbi:succinate dehydrogenase assembly factor 2 [Kaustia mangrovi]|uniref:FAD assembly factor SdhE n=1 Tax=Kaustia mangrovi TaxID=2593653 RepID=A0A7S8C1H5_9HYPH|nr:succinate dehydrogenase assembly factor 2 [Kaustia mangrovi]QPC41642.1 succinate dehydrogenase assembly factor 2 [Kaustia mangrovi]
MSTKETIETRKRRIAWRAAHRGMKEMDLLLGGFVRERIGDMDAAALDELEALVALPDGTLYNWIAGREAVPAEYDTPLLAALMAVRYRPGDYARRQG